MVLTIILPSTAQIYANSDDYKNESFETMELTEQDINDLQVLSQYLKYDEVKQINLYDIERAKANNVEERLIADAEFYNKELLKLADSLELEGEESEKKGRLYFKIIGSAYYEIGLSSTVCKAIINVAKSGAKALAGYLIALFPPIAPFVTPIANLFINSIAKNLKKYTSTGVVIKIRKMSGEWKVWYYQQ